MDNQTKPLKTTVSAPANALIDDLRRQFRASQARVDQLEARIERTEAEFGIKPPKTEVAAPANALHGDDVIGQFRALRTRAERLEARQIELLAAVQRTLQQQLA